ncbi:MAG: hypothetical protein V5A64_02050 [Candidatus Thermoplasmatota archaeon]
MSEVIQYRDVVALDYSLEKGEIKIRIDGIADNYYSDIDKLSINPEETDLSSIQVFKNCVRLFFSSPTICNLRSSRYFNNMICGVKFEGKDEDKVVEKLEGLSERLKMEESRGR